MNFIQDSAQPDIQEGVALHLQGKLDAAAQAYERILAGDRDNLPALLHLGAVRISQSRSRDALAIFQQAVAIAPESAEAHANLATALQAEGQHRAAIEAYHRALAIQPGMTAARFGLAACHQAIGDVPAAIACYESVFAESPGHAEAHYGLATLLVSLGRAEEAIVHYRAALAADPDFAEASYGLGDLLARNNRSEEAASLFRQALDVDPDYAEARLGLAVMLQDLEQDAEAVEAFRAVVTADPENTVARHGLANSLARLHRYTEALSHLQTVLQQRPENANAAADCASTLLALGRHREAMDWCNRALSISPELPDALSVLSQLLAETGEMEPAVTLSRRALELAPERVELAYRLSQLTRLTPEDPVFTALRERLAVASSLPVREQCAVHFALAKAYGDINAHELGFSHLLQGNALKRRTVSYDESTVIGTMERIQRVFTADLIASRSGGGCQSGLPIFIVGMPRSGTTLCEQVLASHPDVFGGGERQELWDHVAGLSAARLGSTGFPESLWMTDDEELAGLGGAYAEALSALAPEARRITDKMPANFQLVGLIHLILPKARVIHMMRDPVDTCLSCFSKLFEGDLNFTYDLGELGRYHRAYQRLMAHWRTALPADAMLEVQYETLVEDFEAECRRILDFCGLTWDERVLSFYNTKRPVRTASLAQIRRPVYRSSVGKWRPDEATLRPLHDEIFDISRITGS